MTIRRDPNFVKLPSGKYLDLGQFRTTGESAMSRAARGPRSDLARYAFGWSDRKPWGHLIIVGTMALIMALTWLT